LISNFEFSISDFIKFGCEVLKYDYETIKVKDRRSFIEFVEVLRKEFKENDSATIDKK
jgi:hypothetical protein